MFNFIDIYSFIHMSGCVDRGTSAPHCPGLPYRRIWIS